MTWNHFFSLTVVFTFAFNQIVCTQENVPFQCKILLYFIWGGGESILAKGIQELLYQRWFTFHPVYCHPSWTLKVQSNHCVSSHLKAWTGMLPLSSFQLSLCCDYPVLSGYLEIFHLLPSHFDAFLLLLLLGSVLYSSQFCYYYLIQVM